MAAAYVPLIVRCVKIYYHVVNHTQIRWKTRDCQGWLGQWTIMVSPTICCSINCCVDIKWWQSIIFRWLYVAGSPCCAIDLLQIHHKTTDGQEGAWWRTWMMLPMSSPMPNNYKCCYLITINIHDAINDSQPLGESASGWRSLMPSTSELITNHAVKANVCRGSGILKVKHRAPRTGTLK